MARSLFSSIEPLESRIAPAALIPILHQLPDLVPGIGKTGATIDLGNMFSNQTFANGSKAGFDTFVDITTNFDTNPSMPGIQAGHIVLELYDGLAPLTVQNFLTYLTSPTAKTGLDNTFFHRLVQGFVLQGGGYKDTNLSTHIVTGPDVHNEANSSNPLLSNTLGTIAMAKTGTGPNTASSEWFVNLANNSSNLDHQNGGFTVFGKVTAASMAVVDGIATLTPADISGITHNSALTSVPVQGGYTTASGKAPTAQQLVDVTSIKVIPPTQATVSGDVFAAASSNPNLVTATVTGETLKLNYKPGATGVANVTVNVRNNAGATATDTFTVTVEPNLIANMGGDTLSQLVAPGSTGTLTATVTNTGGGIAKGHVDVTYYLEPVSTTGAVVLDSHAVQIGSFPNQPIDLASGASVNFSESVKLPSTLKLTNGDSYQVIAKVTPSTGSGITELFTDDNYSLDGQSHVFNSAAKTNLVATSSGDTLPVITVPGDGGTATIQIANNSSFEAKGPVTVTFFLSQATDPSNPQNATVQPGDEQLGSVSESIDLLPGKNLSVMGNLKVPNRLFESNGQVYVVLAEVTSTGPNAINEVSTADNKTTATQEHYAYNAFGTFSLPNGVGMRQNVPLTYTDSNKNVVTLNLSGYEAGIVTVEDTSDAIPKILDLQTGVFGTDGIGNLWNTTLSATVTEPKTVTGSPVLNNITTTSPIGHVLLSNLNVTGNVDIQAGVESLALGNLLNVTTSPTGIHTTPNTIHLGTSAAASGILPTVQFARVADYSLTADSPVASLSALSWTDVNASGETISAPGLNNFHVTGNLQADVTINAATVPTSNPGLSTSPVKNFFVGGLLENSTVQIAADVGSVSLGAMNGSDFLVAVNQTNGAPVIPASRADFAAIHTIGSFVITDAGMPAGTFGMVASTVAAANFNSIVVTQPDTRPEAANFGFIAETIAKYSDVHGGTTTDLTNLPSGVDDQHGNYAVTVLAS